MKTDSRRLWITLGILLGIACLCAAAIVVIGLAVNSWNVLGLGQQPSPTASQTQPSTAPQKELTATRTPESTHTERPEITRTPAPTATTCQGEDCSSTPAALAEDIARQMDGIQADVEELRQLEAVSGVQRALLSPEQLRQRVMDDFMADYTPEDAQNDALVMWALGFLDPDFDLMSFYTELYAEQIAGFYDNETDEMFVVQGESFQGPERLTYSHEYVHALQDQIYDVRNRLNYNEEGCEEDSERCAGIQALMEGDASLVQQAWFFSYSTEKDREEVSQFYQDYESPVFDAAPEFMRQNFLFPYQQGLEFVNALYDQDGWDAVNQAYQDPPVSTEQILHPDRYPDDKPLKILLPDLLQVLGDGWEELDSDVMGEWWTYLILGAGQTEEARLPMKTAQQAAEGWGGDAYAVYGNAADQITLVLKSEWDTTNDAREFASAFEEYANTRWGSSSKQESTLTWQSDLGWVQFTRDGKLTTWIIAVDQATAQKIQAAIME
jgi:hypothetical protein